LRSFRNKTQTSPNDLSRFRNKRQQKQPHPMPQILSLAFSDKKEQHPIRQFSRLQVAVTPSVHTFSLVLNFFFFFSSFALPGAQTTSTKQIHPSCLGFTNLMCGKSKTCMYMYMLTCSSTKHKLVIEHQIATQNLVQYNLAQECDKTKFNYWIQSLHTFPF
jgi:hypothetical protein